jgi:hypothetical protein
MARYRDGWPSGAGGPNACERLECKCLEYVSDSDHQDREQHGNQQSAQVSIVFRMETMRPQRTVSVGHGFLLVGRDGALSGGTVAKSVVADSGLKVRCRRQSRLRAKRRR